MSVVLARPAPRVTRARRLVGPAATIGTLSLVTLALRLRDPHQHGSWGFCPSAAMGVYCPGCGGLRAVNDLTHGQVGAAASSNLLLIAAMPVVVFLLGRWFLDVWTGRTRAHSARLAGWSTAVALVAMAAFTVARNLPVGAWLAP
jgi:hypothetical protein